MTFTTLNKHDFDVSEAAESYALWFFVVLDTPSVEHVIY